MRRIFVAAAIPLLLLVGSATTGCECSPTCEVSEEPHPASEHSIRVWSGDGQVGPAGQQLAQEIVGEYLHEGRHRFVNCIFEIESGGGILRSPGGVDLGLNPGGRIHVSPGDGYCRATWVMGAPGVATVKVLFFHFLDFQRGDSSGRGCTYSTGAGLWLNCRTDEHGFVRFTARAHGPAAAIEPSDGYGQSGDAGQPLPTRPQARVVDAGGNPVPGINVVFAAEAGSGTPSDWVGAVTNRLGDARSPEEWVLGPAEGTHYLQAAAVESDGASPRLPLTGNPARFSAVARPLVASRVDILDGDGQTTTAGQPVSQPVRVKVTDQVGGPVAGVIVTFFPDGPGSVSNAEQPTDANGIAQPGSWTPGAGMAGTYGLWARAPLSQNIANNPVRFTATAVGGPPPTTNVLTLYNGTGAAANLVLPGETPSAANSLGPSGTRAVQIPTAIGTAVTVRAFVANAEVASTTCTVTANTWRSGGLPPLVALFSDGGYHLSCNSF